MAWTQTLDQFLLADPGEIIYEYSPTKSVVAFLAECPDARPSWKLAARGTCIVPINELNGNSQSGSHYFRVYLGQLHCIKGEFLKIRLSIPYWITTLRLQVWEEDGELLPTAPLVGEIKQFVFTSGNSWTDQNGYIWLSLNGQSIGKSGSGATSQGDKYKRLFTHLWSTPMSINGWRGASADADWDAGKIIWIPDMRGRSPMGAGQGPWLSSRSVGQQVGAETHSLSELETGVHFHTGSTSSTGGHLHSLTADTGGSHNHTATTDTHTGHSHTGTNSAIANHTHTGTIASGGAHEHNTSARFSPTALGQFMGIATPNTSGSQTSIASSTHSGHSHALTITEAGGHTHTLTVDSGGSHSHSTTIDTHAGHTHPLTQGSSGVHSHTLNTSFAGSGQPHNNVHPSFVLTFLIATGEK